MFIKTYFIVNLAHTEQSFTKIYIFTQPVNDDDFLSIFKSIYKLIDLYFEKC